MATNIVAHQASTSSSSSSSSKHWIYEVFLSFRGKDTRTNFTGHLYMALKDAGINAFIDDNELRRGENISEELVRAIQGSRISLIVFSRRYADSSWCLEELVEIMECRRTLGQIVFPVFFDVDPSDVRKQSGTLAEAFDQKHKNQDENKVKRWRAVLTEAANLSGWDLRNTANGHEGELIRKIIHEINTFLNDKDFHVASYEVGLGSRVQDITPDLGVGTSDDVRLLGIWGMGGIGKTTLAKALYNKFSDGFEGSSFLADVRETMQKKGEVSLQESLLSDISRTTRTEVGHVHRGINVIKSILGCRRVFVVFDDVDQVHQIENLAIDRDSFGPGSRILITTRDEHLLKQLEVDVIYRVQQMNEEEALSLFSLHAFKTRYPVEGYHDLSRSVVARCGGLPLALQVLGSHLFNRSRAFWESTMKKLETIPLLHVQEKLKISFDGLNDDTERDIFLDISCFFIGKDMDYAKQILDSCDFFPDSGIEVLIERCLVSVNERNELTMHDLLRDMGREIVRAKCRDNPGKWSRVWRKEDVIEVLRDDSGSEEIQGLTLEMHEHGEMPEFRTEAFAEMKRLRFLQLHYVQLSGGYKFLFNKLRWLCWQGCPLEFIPKDFNLRDAVGIELQNTELRHVWEDSGVLAKLKILNLSNSFHLVKSPDFSNLPNLEKLVLTGCWSLREVHQSIGGLKKLSLVNLRGCYMLKELPKSFYKSKSIETLVLDDCERFEKLDEDIGDMASLSILHADNTAIKRLPSSIVRLKNLGCVSLDQCWSEPVFFNLILPPKFQGLSSLVELSLCGHSLTNVPRDHGNVSSSGSLDQGISNLQTLPSLSGLSKLETLFLHNCNLTDEAIIAMDLESLSSLKHLYLDWNNFCSLPSLRSLSKLEILCVRDCRNLLAIPDLPASLMVLLASDCTALETMPDFSEMSNMRLLKMEASSNVSAIFKDKILQGWNFIGGSGIFLPRSDVPKWLTWVNARDTVKFKVPQMTGSNVIALTVCFTCSTSNIRDEWESSLRPFYHQCNGPSILVKNRTKCTSFTANPVSPTIRGSILPDYLWLGHLPINKFNLEGGDLTEVSVSTYSCVSTIGISVVWDTKEADFRVDTDVSIKKACSSSPMCMKRGLADDAADDDGGDEFDGRADDGGDEFDGLADDAADDDGDEFDDNDDGLAEDADDDDGDEFDGDGDDENDDEFDEDIDLPQDLLQKKLA